MIKQHNGRSVPQRTSEGTATNQTSGDQNPPIISNHNKDLYGDESQTTMVLHLVTVVPSRHHCLMKTSSKQSKRRDPHQSYNIVRQTIKQIYHDSKAMINWS